MATLTKKQRDAIKFGHIGYEGDKLVSKLFNPNGTPMFSPDGTMLDDKGNRSVFDDVAE